VACFPLAFCELGPFGMSRAANMWSTDAAFYPLQCRGFGTFVPERDRPLSRTVPVPMVHGPRIEETLADLGNPLSNLSSELRCVWTINAQLLDGMEFEPQSKLS